MEDRSKRAPPGRPTLHFSAEDTRDKSSRFPRDRIRTEGSLTTGNLMTCEMPF